MYIVTLFTPLNEIRGSHDKYSLRWYHIQFNFNAWSTTISFSDIHFAKKYSYINIGITYECLQVLKLNKTYSRIVLQYCIDLHITKINIEALI